MISPALTYAVFIKFYILGEQFYYLFHFFCHLLISVSGKIPRNFSGIRIFNTKSTDLLDTKTKWLSVACKIILKKDMQIAMYMYV